MSLCDRLYLLLRRLTVDAPFHPSNDLVSLAVHNYKVGDN